MAPERSNSLPAADFPLEVIDEITQYVVEDRKTLLLLGLVSKQWKISSRHHLFSTVSFHDVSDIYDFHALATSETKCSIPERIQQIHISLFSLENLGLLQGLQDILSYFTVQHSVSVEGAPPSFLIELSECWMNIKGLRLSNCTFPTSSFLVLLGRFRNLESLWLEGVHFVEDAVKQSPSPSHSFLKYWKTLSLSRVSNFWISMPECIVEKMAALKTLAIEDHFLSHDKETKALLQHFDNGLFDELEDVFLYLARPSRYIKPELPALPFGTELKTLRICFQDLAPPMIPATLSRGAGSLEGVSLKTLELCLCVPGGPTIFCPSATLYHLDLALCRLRNHMLLASGQQPSFDVVIRGGSWLHSADELKLPMTMKMKHEVTFVQCDCAEGWIDEEATCNLSFAADIT